MSDPRAVILKRYAGELAKGTEFEREFNLLTAIERLSPEVILDVKGTKKDMRQRRHVLGFAHSMLGFPTNLFTPLFCCARMAGWSAHRFEELVSGKRIIRPAYKSTRLEERVFMPIDER